MDVAFDVAVLDLDPVLRILFAVGDDDDGLAGLETLDLEDDVLVAVVVGGEEGGRPIRFNAFGKDILAGARRGNEGVFVGKDIIPSS